MAAQRITAYTFNPSARTVTLTGLTVDLGGLLVIADQTTGATLFISNTPSLIATAAGSVVTLNTAAPLTGAQPGDALLIMYDFGGTPTVAPGPYSYAPLSPGQHNVALTSSTGLTIPSGATYATVQANGGTVKYTTDGTTTPTSSVGMTLGAGATVPLSGAATIANFRAISASATLDVEYYR